MIDESRVSWNVGQGVCDVSSILVVELIKNVQEANLMTWMFISLSKELSLISTRSVVNTQAATLNSHFPRILRLRSSSKKKIDVELTL